jgi:hypothetical protein
METKGVNPVLHEQFHQIVEQQIRENNPRETKETLDRLIILGYSRHEAIHKIGAVVVEELFDVLKSREKFDRERFIDRLSRLK